MGFLITTLILFAFTLLVPGLASQDNETLQERIALLENEVNTQRRIGEALREQGALKEDILNADERVLAKALELQQAQVELATAQGEATKEQINDLIRAEKALESFKEEHKETREEIDKLKGASQNFAKSFVSDLAGMVGMAKRFEDTFVGGFMQSVKSAGSLRGALKNITSEFNKTFTAANMASSVFAKIAEVSFGVAFAQSEARSSFMRTTGASEEFAQSINRVYFETRQFGVDSREAGAATEALFSNMAAFSRESRNTREALIRQTALMAEFGVSNEVTTRSLDVMTRVLGMTSAESIRASEDMVQFARNIGVPPAQMIEELTATAPQLAQWGGRTADVLMDVAATSKATGIAMGELVGIARQFDTFEGAAEAAGRLNAMLGGPFLNNVELLMAEPAEKINLLSDAIAQSGQDFSSMGRFMQESIARAAGISDMSQAARIFGMNTRDAARELERQNEEQRTAEERAQRAQSATENFTIAIQQFAANIQPLIEFVSDFAVTLSNVIGKITESRGATMALVGSFTILAGAAMVSAIVGFTTKVATGFTVLRGAISGTAAAVTTLKNALRGLAMATGAGALAVGLGFLAETFMPQSPPLSHWINESAEGLSSLGNVAGRTQSQIARLNQNGLGQFEQTFTPQSPALSERIGNTNRQVTAQAASPAAITAMESIGLAPSTGLFGALFGGGADTEATTGTSNEMLARIAKGTEQNTRLLAKMANSDYKIVMNEREFGKATRGVVERQFAFDKSRV